MRKLLRLWEEHVERWYDLAMPIYRQKWGMTLFVGNGFRYWRMMINLAFGYYLSIFIGRRLGIILAQPIPFFRVRLWWHRLFIRKDEFHRSLDMDTDAMVRMTEAEQKEYRWDLVRRRNIAHERDLAGH